MWIFKEVSLKTGSRIYLGVAFLVFAVSSCFGFWYGKKGIEDWFKISIMIGSHLASEDFKEGNIEQALSGAYRMKAFERDRGRPDPLFSERLSDDLFGRPAVDLILGKVFLKKNQPCLAQAYLIDGFTHLNQEKVLTEQPVYKETAQILLEIGQNCEQWGKAP
jgi:hypothetical protein